MTNINCSSNCNYQKDGKCMLENVFETLITPTKDCAYFKNGNPDYIK